METNQLNILDLDDYCLGRILKYLKAKDHVNFAQSCHRFREILKDWALVLYPQFKLEDSEHLPRELIKWQCKLFFIVCDVIKKFYLEINQIDVPASAQHCLPVDDICNHIKTMENLEYFAVSLGCIFNRSFRAAKPVRNEILEQIISSLKHLPNLKSVSVRNEMNRFNPMSLVQLKCLQEVSINSTITSKDLVAICKSNPSLRVLWLREVVGELIRIVPHCKKLEEIAFHMLRTCKNRYYARLAELPNIKKIVIKSTSSPSPCANLIDIFNAFANTERETPLESLILFSSLNFDETSKLIELKSLKELRCKFHDARCIDLLTDLTELEGLYIIFGRSGAGGKEYLKILNSFRNLRRLHFYSENDYGKVENHFKYLHAFPWKLFN